MQRRSKAKGIKGNRKHGEIYLMEGKETRREQEYIKQKEEFVDGHIETQGKPEGKYKKRNRRKRGRERRINQKSKNKLRNSH